MLRALRRVAVVLIRHGFKAVAGFLLLAWGTTLLAPRSAAADETCEKWKKVALSSVGLGQRLQAVETLRALGSTASLDALEDVARDGDLRIGAAACAALGRAGSSGSKDRLKALVEDGGLSTHLRVAAAACIAEHWKDGGDESWLEEKAEGNAALAAHVSVLKTRVYGE